MHNQKQEGVLAEKFLAWGPNTTRHAHAALAGTIHERASPSAPTDDHAAVFFRKRVRIGLSTKSASAAVTMSSVMAALKTGTQLPAC